MHRVFASPLCRVRRAANRFLFLPFALESSALFAQSACPFAVTGSAIHKLLNDGLALQRYALGANDAALIANLGVGTPSAAIVRQRIFTNSAQLDVDGDDDFTITDATTIARNLAGFRNDDLAKGLQFAAKAQQNAGVLISDYIANGCPTLPLLAEEFSSPYSNCKNVKDYGAVGNGIADDTAAIQAALNALKNVQTNSRTTLYFPAGTYRITTQLTTARYDYCAREYGTLHRWQRRKRQRHAINVDWHRLRPDNEARRTKSCNASRFHCAGQQRRHGSTSRCTRDRRR
jgi:Pectate lyase superfamily protein